MLIRFGFSNFKSIKDYQQISFVASSLSDDYADLISPTSINESVLPTIAIYGGNATGKSNVLKAIKFFCEQVLNSHTRGSASGGISRDYFLLNKASQDEPSLFDCDFILNSIHYHYGFSIDNEQIIEEWLYAYPKKHRQIWFHRNINEKKIFHFGKNLKGINSIIESLTRKNSLFLSSAAQNNHGMLMPVYEFFKNNIAFDFNRGEISPETLESYLGNNESKDWLIKFLSSADIGIIDILLENITPEKLIHDLHPIDRNKKTEFKEPEPFKHIFSILLEPDDSTTHFPGKSIRVVHSCNDGSPVALKLSQESLGTIKLIGILGPVYNALEQGVLLVIDEMDTSLHPSLSRLLIQLFQSGKTNPNSAQLLFSTHDTNLLAGNLLRRDQVWFTEKDDCGATNIYPLSDISTRKGDNIESGYLQGRYGAIPFLGNIDAMFERTGD